MSKNFKYIVYKITNTINGKIYIGAEKTKNIFDKYYGSGTLIKKAVKKYGIENFKKEILYVFNNQKDMYEKERELVNEKFIKKENTYNLRIGGKGGWGHIDNSGENNGMIRKSVFDVWQEKYGTEKAKIMWDKRYPKNRIWINDGGNNTKHINKKDLDKMLNKGWYLGRKLHDKEAGRRHQINSVPRAVAIALEKFVDEAKGTQQNGTGEQLEKCPKCMRNTWVNEGGCGHCIDEKCLFEKCD